jgi:hypothetical protein
VTGIIGHPINNSGTGQHDQKLMIKEQKYKSKSKERQAVLGGIAMSTTSSRGIFHRIDRIFRIYRIRAISNFKGQTDIGFKAEKFEIGVLFS